MKRLLVGVLLLFFFLGIAKSVRAQLEQQNVVLSCLDITPIAEGDSPFDVDGKTFYHGVNLRNREVGVFSPTQPVYIVRSLPRVFCNPNSNDPNCTIEENRPLSTCIQEKVGADVCNQNCAWDTYPGCYKDNTGRAGETLCCMPPYSKQGPYFECAKDRNGETICPAAIMAAPGQSNGIHHAEDGHIETGWYSTVMITSTDKGSIIADANGNISVEKVSSYTAAGLEHSFYGMQILSDKALSGEEALTNSLKLAVFAEIENIEPSATNCTTVWWDPYGRVIDALKLEPIPGVNILLRNLNPFGQVVTTTQADNPAFLNPRTTDAGGGFNFAVSPGTYFLTPNHKDFTFPIESSVLSGALSALSVFDPAQEYFARDKSYNNSDEKIIEKEGQSERRDIILQPKDANYAGSTPVVIYAENLRDNNNQLVRGRTSHPKSIVRVLINNGVVGQTVADLDGRFSITIPQESVGTNSGLFQVVAEKVPLTTAHLPKKGPGLLSALVGKVLAQASTTSKPYTLSFVPVRLSGLVFDTNLKVKPNATVKLTVPSLGGIAFAQAQADKDGFINVSATNLPPFDFTLTVEDGQNPENNYQLTVEDFKKANSVYLAETNTNLYNDSVPVAKPDQETLDKIIRETPTKVSLSSLSANQKPRFTPTPTQSVPTTQGSSGLMLAAVVFFVAIIAAIVFLIIKRSQNKKVYY